MDEKVAGYVSKNLQSTKKQAVASQEVKAVNGAGEDLPQSLIEHMRKLTVKDNGKLPWNASLNDKMFYL